MDPIFEFLKEQIGLGGLVLLIAVCAVCFFVWKFAVAYGKKTTEIDNLPCDKHEKIIENFGSDINEINVKLGKLETGQEDIHRMMQLMTGQSPISQFTQSHSPISLTEKGKEVAQSLEFEKIINENWTAISSIIDDEKNPYDIQTEFISSFMTGYDKYIDPDSLDRIKKDAFSRGVPLIEYLRMLGVMSRDKYFSEHNIDVSEVDSSDPSKAIV